MSSYQKEQIQAKLKSIPAGVLRTRIYPLSGRNEPIISEYSCSSMKEKGKIDKYELYRGIDISFFDYLTEQNICRHEASDDILEINYCRFGRIGLNMKDGSTIYLGEGDFSVHTRDLCADCVMTLPNGYYSGICISISLKQLTLSPPDIIKEAGLTGDILYRKFCPRGTFSTLHGSEKTEPIFGGFYSVPHHLQIPYFKVKILELLLYLYASGIAPSDTAARYQKQQIEIIKKVHDFLVEGLDRRVTIEDLSKQFLMNPSTMKAVFKAVYGSSIAAHIKEHRMAKAAELLLNTEDSIASIAKAVGYESQSKFSAEFRKSYQQLPTVYRQLRKHSAMQEFI